MDVPSVTASAMRPIFAVPPVRPVPAVARQPDFAEEVGREAPKDRIELSADAKRALAGAPSQPPAPSYQPYGRGSAA
jgi:hypothetical protein